MMAIAESGKTSNGSGPGAGLVAAQRRIRLVFLFLVLVQATHSIEEYATGLYAVFAPARWVSGLVSENLSVGFALVNGAFVTFGLWCFLVPIRSDWPSARSWAWLWVVIELFNGIGHTALALSVARYFPGAITAPVLFVVAAWLAVLLLKSQPRSGGTGLEIDAQRFSVW